MPEPKSIRRINARCVEMRLRINVSKVDSENDPQVIATNVTYFSFYRTYLPLLGFAPSVTCLDPKKVHGSR